MKSTINWQGVYPAVTTQFSPDGQLDLAATSRHVEILIQAGVHGLVMLGTVGENCSLEHDEKIAVARAAVKTADGRVPVLVGVAECTTRRACHFASDAQTAGVDGLMVLPAMVYRADPREAMAHFREVAQASELPIMCYNNPVSYGVDLTPDQFAQLADEEKFVAIKESSDDPRRITDLIHRLGDRYILFNGVDDLALEAVLLGVSGWVSGLVNALPEESMRLWQLAVSGQWEEARELYRWFTPLLHLDTHVKLVQYIKLTMAECGLGSETVRLPRLPLEGHEREQILTIIRDSLATRPGA